MTRHIFKWKEKEVQEIQKLAAEYPVIAVANIERFPSALFQQLRKKLKSSAVVKVSKVRVARMALQQSKVKPEKLLPHVEKSVALIFTKTNPFELYAFLKKNKGQIYAKPGMIAEDDIVIPAGDTGLPPGPALSDLKNAGLKVRVQGATIAITEDAVVTKKGQPITAPVASTLAKLDIKPIRVGMNLTACYENGEVFKADVLNIDTEKVFNNFVTAHRSAFNIAFNSEYFTKETTPLLVSKAFREAKAVALEANILTKYTVQDTIAKAALQAKAIKELVKEEANAETAKENN